MNLPTDRSDTPGGAPDNGSSPELEAAYARASLADGSRPSLSVRASILANAQREAAAHASHIEPTAAANDSLWSWRAAAGFVGVAFAGVLSLWLYRGNPTPQSPTLQPPVPQPPVLQSPVLQPAPQSAPQATSRSQPPPQPVPQLATSTPDVASSIRQKSVQRAADSVAPMAKSAQPERELQEVVETRQRARAMSAARAALASAPPAAEALLQHWFPQALDSNADGLQYWFVLDRNGTVLNSGQSQWRDLPALQRVLESDAPHRIARMESAHFVNRRSHDVELAYAWTAD
jgi:outer membrane biosynthesis protein TonB